MSYTVEAACLCNTGHLRKNNEDNFFFDGRCLEESNRGLRHPVVLEKELSRELCIAVFDGMGGENYGETASFIAANAMKKSMQRVQEYVIPERRFLNDMCQELNCAVVEKAKAMHTERMGSTLVSLYFTHDCVYVCNLGDSRAYRLRDGEFLQLSVDHVEKLDGADKRKMPLTQHLGIDPEQLIIEPYIAKGFLRAGDKYLLCSDGLTDMLSNLEIDEILNRPLSTEECVQQLVKAALEKGGRDNVTVIVCRVQ